ncbi:hypothetical protein ACFPN7_25955 [Amycolatopsis halotolerans]|uniref:hypothetical protein n=1 Tax=Amycolatopsis halotolerans TaxID=330083 RepID=UPI00361F6C4B
MPNTDELLPARAGARASLAAGRPAARTDPSWTIRVRSRWRPGLAGCTDQVTGIRSRVRVVGAFAGAAIRRLSTG